MGMKSNEVFQELFQKHNIKQIADDLGLASSYLYKWAQPDGGKASGGLNPLERIATMRRSTDDLEPLHWLCREADGYFVANARAGVLPADLVPAEKEALRRLGNLLVVVSATARNNCVSMEDAASIRSRWEELKGAMEGFVAGCERGSFRQQTV